MPSKAPPPPPDGSSSSPPPESSPPSPPPPSTQSPPPTALPPPSTQPPPSPPPPSSSPPPPDSKDSSPPPPPPNSNDSSSPPPPPPPPTPPPPPPPPQKATHGEFIPSSQSSKPHNLFTVSLSSNLVIGVAAGIGALLILLIIACIVSSKIKKRKPHDQMRYYSGNSGKKGNDLYSVGPSTQWPNGQSENEHIVNLPQQQIWHPPPPPPLMTGSEASSAFSGPHAPSLPPPLPILALGFNQSTFTYEELAAATSGFAPTSLLGQGGFGYVYRGVLPNGKEIAVKLLKSESRQGEREFHAEVEIISRIHHRHLVSLVGYCIAGAHRVLVYEFVPNKTLEYHLHAKGLPVMEWPTRLKIALGAAKGIAYLHEDCHPRIIHRDIKSSNILLDFNFEAMVADFGLAKLTTDNHTHVSTRVMGTFGYLAPEYASSGKLTEKSDVFSYGVMLLELITGQPPVDSSHKYMEDSLVDWARPALSRALADGNYDELVDPRLEGNYNALEMARLVASAAASIRHSAKGRPKMSQILRALEGDVSLEDLNDGVKTGQSALLSSGSEESLSQTSSINRVRRVVVASPETSNEYSAQM